MKFEFVIDLVLWGPHRDRIHKDDLACAICAWFNGRLKRREKRGTTIVEVAEDFFISGLVGVEIKRVVNATDIAFLHRFLDANKRGKTPPLFDLYDLWLLCNWRTLHLNDGRKLPGLREWSVSAIEKLARWKFPVAKRIERLGLHPGGIIFFDAVKQRFIGDTRFSPMSLDTPLPSALSTADDNPNRQKNTGSVSCSRQRK